MSNPYLNLCVVHLSMNCCITIEPPSDFAQKQSFWNCIYSHPKAGSINRAKSGGGHDFTVIIETETANLSRIRYSISNSTNLRQDIAKWRVNLFSHIIALIGAFVHIHSNSTADSHHVSNFPQNFCDDNSLHSMLPFSAFTNSLWTRIIMQNCVDSSD